MEAVDNIEVAVVEPSPVADVKDEPAPAGALPVAEVADVKDGVDDAVKASPKPHIGRVLQTLGTRAYWRGDLDAEYCRAQCEATAHNLRVAFMDKIHDVANEAANLARGGAQYCHDTPEHARDDVKYFRGYLLEASGLLAKMADMELKEWEVREVSPHVESL
jgi:hypothetical protein